MNNLLPLTFAFLAGIPIGAFFFGGLWWTVKKGVTSRKPVLWFFGSLMIRIGVTIAGFYVMANGHWERAVACLAGFLIARSIVMRITKPTSANQVHLAKEVNHEN